MGRDAARHERDQRAELRLHAVGRLPGTFRRHAEVLELYEFDSHLPATNRLIRYRPDVSSYPTMKPTHWLTCFRGTINYLCGTAALHHLKKKAFLYACNYHKTALEVVAKRPSNVSSSPAGTPWRAGVRTTRSSCPRWPGWRA